MIKDRIQGQFETDVVVFGGGMAGISAALAAARMGKEVTLVEKQCLLGGLATQGLVTIFLPLCDGNGHQVIHGIAEELLKLSIKHGWEESYPSAWLSSDDYELRKRQRYMVQYNPNLFALEIEKLLLDNGVRIFYDTQLIALETEEEHISSSIILRKDGFFALYAKQYIDTTGDLVSAQSIKLNHSIYEQNMPAAWYYSDSKHDGRKLQMLGLLEMADDSNVKTERISEDVFSGLNGDENDRILCLTHQKILEHLRVKQKEQRDFIPVALPGILQIRMSRRLHGNAILEEKDSFVRFEDSIAVVGNWKKRGPVYELPFSCLYTNEYSNLLTAGRSINVSDDMWDITRVIPCCCITGEAAGTAAALAMENDVRNLDVHDLQEQLRNNGVRVHIDEIDMN